MLRYYYTLFCFVLFFENMTCLNTFAIYLLKCIYCPATFTRQPFFTQVSCISIFQIKLNYWIEQKKWLKVGRDGGNNETGWAATERRLLKAVTPEGWEYLQQRSLSAPEKSFDPPRWRTNRASRLEHSTWNQPLPLHIHTHTHLITHSLTHPHPADNIYSQTQHKVCRNFISTDHDQPRPTTRFLSFLINIVDREFNFLIYSFSC